MVGGRRILTEGFLAGVLGYIVVAAGIALLDVLAGRSPFHTVAVLGSVLFFGLRDATDLTIGAGPVLAYNGAHFAVFLVFGVFMAWLASLSERGPQMWYVSLMVFLVVVPHVIGLPMWFDRSIAEVVSLWGVVAATTAAALVMGAWLWHAHPRLHEELRREAA